MPQMNKGGKFIFGESMIRPDGRVQLPPQAVDEYRIASEGKVYLFTGSKITGGFCVTREGLLLPSKLGHILTETPSLLHYEVPAGTFLPYKGRSYCWTAISASGEITLTEEMMAFLHAAFTVTCPSDPDEHLPYHRRRSRPLFPQFMVRCS